MLKLKRAYDPAATSDGQRILVDRLWPRGVTKARAGVDLWLKEIAPSPDLRKWFDHDPDRWIEFRKRYWKELKANTEPVKVLQEKIKHGVVTLVFAARDTEHCHALALKEFLER